MLKKNFILILCNDIRNQFLNLLSLSITDYLNKRLNDDTHLFDNYYFRFNTYREYNYKYDGKIGLILNYSFFTEGYVINKNEHTEIYRFKIYLDNTHKFIDCLKFILLKNFKNIDLIVKTNLNNLYDNNIRVNIFKSELERIN